MSDLIRFNQIKIRLNLTWQMSQVPYVESMEKPTAGVRVNLVLTIHRNQMVVVTISLNTF